MLFYIFVFLLFGYKNILFLNRMLASKIGDGLRKCFGSVLISIRTRIRIQHFRSIRIRIQVFV